MNKYAPLEQFLQSSDQGFISMTFSELEQILGDTLPKSAYIYDAWWGNGWHLQARAWLDAGYKAEQVHLEKQTVCFRRTKLLCK